VHVRRNERLVRGQGNRGEGGHNAALVSCFDVTFPTRSTVKHKPIVGLMALEQDLTKQDPDDMDRFREWARTTQKCVYRAYPLVHLGAAAPVNTDVVHSRWTGATPWASVPWSRPEHGV